MIARAIFLFLVFAIVFFTLYWAAFRARFFNVTRVVEIVKTSALVVIAVASAVMAVATIVSIDKLF